MLNSQELQQRHCAKTSPIFVEASPTHPLAAAFTSASTNTSLQAGIDPNRLCALVNRTISEVSIVDEHTFFVTSEHELYYFGTAIIDDDTGLTDVRCPRRFTNHRVAQITYLTLLSVKGGLYRIDVNEAKVDSDREQLTVSELSVESNHWWKFVALSNAKSGLLMIDQDGNIYEKGCVKSMLMLVKDGMSAKKIGLSDYYQVILSTDGTVYHRSMIPVSEGKCAPKFLSYTKVELLEKVDDIYVDNGIALALSENRTRAWVWTIASQLKFTGVGVCPSLISGGTFGGRPIKMASERNAATRTYDSYTDMLVVNDLGEVFNVSGQRVFPAFGITMPASFLAKTANNLVIIGEPVEQCEREQSTTAQETNLTWTTCSTSTTWTEVPTLLPFIAMWIILSSFSSLVLLVITKKLDELQSCKWKLLKADLKVQQLDARFTQTVTLIPFDQLTKIRRLGRGGFAEVHLVIWQSKIYAYKQFHPDHSSTATDSIEEAKTAMLLASPHVVHIYGRTENPYGVLMEYMNKGSLDDMLFKNSNSVSHKQATQIALEVATAVELMHARGVIHCDIKPDNVLIHGSMYNSKLYAKVSDFGVSKVIRDKALSASTSQSKLKGSFAYMAPEILKLATIEVPTEEDERSSKPMRQSDVYSFGVFLFELICRKKAYQGKYFISMLSFAVQVTKEHLRPEFGASCASHWRELIQLCWLHDPAQRLTMNQVVTRLCEIQNME